jgi:hypothetical protein
MIVTFSFGCWSDPNRVLLMRWCRGGGADHCVPARRAHPPCRSWRRWDEALPRGALRDADAIEVMRKVDTLAVDKTGTLKKALPVSVGGRDGRRPASMGGESERARTPVAAPSWPARRVEGHDGGRRFVSLTGRESKGDRSGGGARV